MKNFFKASLAVGAAFIALSAQSKAQTVAVNGIGSSAMFLELGLATATPTTSSPAGLGASCLWTGSGAVATDTVVSPSATDTGNAFVAWTAGTGTCAAPVSPTIYAYLQTDSVVGNRCLYNSTCKISYAAASAPANFIGPMVSPAITEIALPTVVKTALTNIAANVAGTDIRPEDAQFAIDRALAGCGLPLASGSQYLGLGYTAGSTIKSFFSTKSFNVVNFTLPGSFTVTPLGATPILVVVNSPAGSGFNASGVTSIAAKNLALFLDGTYTTTGQVNSATPSGSTATTIEREPLSGTYNTMEFNIPNTSNATTGFKTSQDVGLDQPTAQQACSGGNPVNPLDIGSRRRAIGTGEELAEILATSNSIGYGFWSVGNFAGYTSANARYLQVVPVGSTTPIDPLLNASTPYSTYNGSLPAATSGELANVDLHNVGNGSYPIWSQLRLVNTGTTPLAAVTSLATVSQHFVPTGVRPDFVPATSLSVVRSHFIPTGVTTVPANGHGSDTGSKCTATEEGGDVGGVVLTLTADSSYCAAHATTKGETGLRN